MMYLGEFGEMKRSVLECTFFKTSSLNTVIVSCLRGIF